MKEDKEGESNLHPQGRWRLPPARAAAGAVGFGVVAFVDMGPHRRWKVGLRDDAALGGEVTKRRRFGAPAAASPPAFDRRCLRQFDYEERERETKLRRGRGGTR